MHDPGMTRANFSVEISNELIGVEMARMIMIFIGLQVALFSRIAYAFEYVRDFSDGVAVVRVNHKYGYIDVAGKVVIPAMFIFADDFRDGRAFARNKDKVDGFIDKSGRFVFVLNRSNVVELVGYSCGRVVYKKINGKYGLLNGEGVDVLPDGIEGIVDASECNYKFKKNGLWGLMNKDGKILLDAIYQDISPAGFESSLLRAKYNDEWVFVNKNGKIILK